MRQCMCAPVLTCTTRSKPLKRPPTFGLVVQELKDLREDR